jgi:ribonucleotide reductase beta subunit family protein with ferritin-like domain
MQNLIVYKPFEYQEAFDYWMKQQQAHWLHTEVPMMSDLNDWKQNLNETEKNIIGSILKGFAQTETIVNDYWSGLVTKWFRKPEVIMMATTFGAFETIHAEAYSLLNETLGLETSQNLWRMKLQWLKLKLLLSVRDSFNGEKDFMKLLNHSLYSQHLPRELIYSLHSPYSYLLRCETSLREWVKLLNGLLETNQCTPKQDVGYLEHLSRKS